jgi:autotransporter-associated beta strand protein
VEEGRLIMAGAAFNANIGLSSITVNENARLWQPPGSPHALGGAWTASPSIVLNEGATYTVDQENYLNSISLTGATVDGSNELRTDLSFQASIRESSEVSIWSARVSGVNSPILFDVADGPLDVDFFMSGKLTGNRGLTKSGPGTMEFSGERDFSGNVVVMDGTLKLTGGESFPRATLIDLHEEAVLDVSELGLWFNLASTQTLAGGGTIMGDVDLQGSLSPGEKDLAGELTVDGVLTVFSESVYHWDVASWTAPSLPGVTHDVVNLEKAEFLATPAAPASIVIKASALQDFSEQDRVYVIARLDEAIPQFNPAVFAIDSSPFVTATGATGTWSVRQTGKTLELAYTAGSSLSGYDAWAQSKGLTGGNAAFGADPDKDGVANAIEFVTGSDPNVGTDSKLPVATQTADAMIVIYHRASASRYLPQVIEVTADPQTGWQPTADGVAGVTVAVQAIDANVDRVTVTIPKNGRPKLFARLKVSEPSL